MTYRVQLLETEFQPFELLNQQQTIAPNVGAQSVFVGYMRDFREDTHVTRMNIAHYPPMTQQHIEQLAAQLIKDFHLHHVYIAHRVGEVYPTSPLVLIAATAAHRANAVRATETALEQLKHTAPFWKKEYHQDGENWVESNTKNCIQPKP